MRKFTGEFGVTATSRFFAGLALIGLLLSGNAIAADASHELDLVLSREVLPYLAHQIPKKYLGVEVHKLLGIPDNVYPEPVTRRFAEETPEQFKTRVAMHPMPSPKDVCNLGTKVAEVNRALSGFADHCSDATGTRFCVRANGLFKTCETAAEELKRSSTTLAIFPPEQWRMLTEETFSANGKSVLPKIDFDRVGYRKVPLKIPGFEVKGIQIPALDLGEVVVAWNKKALEEKLNAAKQAGAKKIVSLLMPDRGPELEAQLTRTLQRLVAKQVTEGGLGKLQTALQTKVFCSDEDRGLGTRRHGQMLAEETKHPVRTPIHD